jgi:hypothetical protein
MAQNEEDISKFLQAGEEDASKLVNAYVAPMIKTLSYGMTGGWYNTAKAHKTLGFDLGVTMNLAFIPTSENYFNPHKLGLSENFTGFVNNSNGSTTKSPTIMGPKDDSDYTFSGDLDGDGDDEDVVFSGPEGFDLKKEIGFAAVPVPVVQLGVGIIKNTDLKLRLIPKQDIGSSEIQMFGIGVMHDVKQHIKGIKLLPFDLSVLVAYNSVSGTSDLRNDDLSDTRPDSPNGELSYKFNSWIFQGIISKKISVLTFYGGVGYTMVKTNFDITGDFEIDTSTIPFTLTDPVSIDFKNNSMRFTAGMRLKLGPVYFSGDYTLQKYNMLTVGFGFAVR